MDPLNKGSFLIGYREDFPVVEHTLLYKLCSCSGVDRICHRKTQGKRCPAVGAGLNVDIPLVSFNYLFNQRKPKTGPRYMSGGFSFYPKYIPGSPEGYLCPRT